MKRALLTGLVVTCVGAASPRVEQSRRFEIDVPAGADTGATYLVLRDVDTPKKTGIVLRAYALLPDSGRVLLGSTAVPAVAPDAEGVTAVRELRVNVTTGLRRWLATSGTARRVRVEITSATAGDTTANRFNWRVRAVELVRPR